MYKPGDLVRHKNKPEWGLGRVTGETGEGKVLVKFAARSGDVLLTADGAEKFLVPDTGVIAAVTAQLNPGAAPTRVAPPPPLPARRVPCVSCAGNILDVRTSGDGLWRSCPACSARSGRHHVYLPFPAAFDVVDAPPPEGDTSADPNGWCNACRAGARATGFKTCFQVR